MTTFLVKTKNMIKLLIIGAIFAGMQTISHGATEVTKQPTKVLKSSGTGASGSYIQYSCVTGDSLIVCTKLTQSGELYCSEHIYRRDNNLERSDWLSLPNDRFYELEKQYKEQGQSKKEQEKQPSKESPQSQNN